LVQQFSAIQFKISGTESGKSENDTFGYTSTVLQPGIYNVTASTFTTNQTISFSFVVDSNNDSVISASYSGYTFTGTEATSEFDALMGLFGLQAYYSSEIGIFTDSAYFTNEGTSTMTFGTVSFPVTTYGLNSANEVVNYCGVSATITAYTLEVGTPPGTSLLFIPYIHFAGTSNGTTEDITFQITSMTLRS